jgi:mercuric ion binding protein
VSTLYADCKMKNITEYLSAKKLTDYKTVKKIFIFAVAVFFAFSGKAQETPAAELKVKTSAVCEMCKTNIEKKLAVETGVKRSSLDLSSKIVTVAYNPNETTPDKVRQAIAKAGYDADDIPANKKAYKKLNACCKKTAH